LEAESTSAFFNASKKPETVEFGLELFEQPIKENDKVIITNKLSVFLEFNFTLSPPKIILSI
jgi:hypothetical protein